MIYCFVISDLLNNDPYNIFRLQAGYAEKLGSICYADLCSRNIYGLDHWPIDITNASVFLRASCDTMYDAANLIAEHHGVLLETMSDVQAIEAWPALQIARRDIITISRSDLLYGSYSEKMQGLLQSCESVFIKTKKKGFSAITPTELVAMRPHTFVQFIEQHTTSDAEEILLSPRLNIKKDYLGNKETRHIVISGEIVNSSRALLSGRHTIPKSMHDYAKTMVDVISKKDWFPRNYVLDLALVELNGVSAVDVIEINPLTCSTCYIQNSIFFNDHSVAHTEGTELIGQEFIWNNNKHFADNRITKSIQDSHYNLSVSC